ncbi:MAG TPA: transposase [Myxococcota bacterium]|nr:transposase [Myxococcota bacterium]
MPVPSRRAVGAASRACSGLPLGRERLEEQPDGSILLRLKTPWSDGTSAIHLTRSELLQRIIALIPPPRKNESLFHGVFASRHAWRSEIVPEPPADSTPAHLRIRLTKEPSIGPAPPWLAWAALLWRIFHEDKISCPHCDKPMRVRTVVMAPATMRVVKGLEQTVARAPPGEEGESAREPLAVVA